MKNSFKKYLLLLLVAIVYFVAARLGLMLAFPGTNATPLWLPTGIALSVVLLWGGRMWPGIALGAFAANFQQLAGLGMTIPASFAASLSTSAGNTLEALIGAYLIYRFTGTRNPFGRSAHVLAFILFGALVSTTISATIGTTTFCLSVANWDHFSSLWLTWWLGDATGAIVVVPLVMMFKESDAAAWKLRPLAGNILLWAFIGVACYIIFYRYHQLSFLLVPVIVIVALRLGQLGSAIAVGIISMVSTYVTINGTGPFSGMTLTEALLLQQGFVGSIASASMVLAASVAEQKDSEQKVRESGERSRMLIEHAPIGIAFSRDGVTLDANKAYITMFGYADIEELRGTPLIEHIAPQSRPEILDRVRKRAQGESVESAYETMGLRKDGSQFPFYVSVNRVVLADGPVTISFFIDITERKRVEEDLQLFVSLADSSKEFIGIADLNFKPFYANAAALKLVGLPDLEAVRKIKVQDVFFPEDQPLITSEFLPSVLREGNGEVEIRFRHFQTNEAIWVFCNVFAIYDTHGKPAGWATVSRNINERKHVELELKHHREHLEDLVKERTAALQDSQRALTNIVEDLNLKTKELETANERLKELDRLKSLFIASMSHELRTPLNSIIGFTGILLQGLAGALNEEQRKQLGMVKSSSQHLLSLITDIIDLSKIEAGKIDLRREPFDLSALVREVLATFQIMAEQKALSLSAETPTGLVVVSDKMRIRQVLVNLVGNAVKFTEKGMVRVSVLQKNEYVEIFVADTGMGILPEDMDKLFKFFSQVTTRETPKHEGTGLGLYLSKKLVTLLGGDIRVESEFGKGSVFSFRLPVEK